jgi:hypothetical protein
MSRYSKFRETLIVFAHTSNPTEKTPSMSGAAAPKSTEGRVSFDPDHKAKTDRNDTWIRERLDPNKEDKKRVADIIGTSSKRGSGQKDSRQRRKVRLDMPCVIGWSGGLTRSCRGNVLLLEARYNNLIATVSKERRRR